jgi:acyl transferase domain-containing protein
MSEREAGLMDPQQRLLLLSTWEALENAAIPPPTLENSRSGNYFVPTGIFFFKLAQTHKI